MAERTSAYWQERFKQMEEAQHDTSVQKVQEIQEQFDRSLAAINGKINAWYQRLADNNGISMQEARKLLNARELKEFQWNVDDYIKYGKENKINGAWEKELENASARVHIGRLEALKIEVQQEAEKLYGNCIDEIDQHIRNTYTSDFYHTAYEIQKGVGVGTTINRLDPRTVEMIVCKPWAVDGKNFSDRLWENKTKLINNLHNSLSRMCITGEAPDRAIAEISKQMKVSRAQAGRVVMTESAAVANKARQDCMKELDVEQFEVVETLDSHTCEFCGSMDGKHFPMSEFQIGVTAPPFHPNCRGCTCPYFGDEFDSVGERAARGEDGKTYYVPADTTYEEWKEQCVDKSPEEKETDEKKTTDYLIRSHIPGQNVTKERKMVNEVVATMPAKVQQALKNTVIDVGKDGASQYDYIHDILYVAQGAEKDGIIHEIGHMVENKILDETKVRNLLNGLIGEVDITQIRQEIFYDNNMNPKEVFLIENAAFVSEYQGRVYCETIWDAFDENGDFRSDLLWEFSSEGFREFIENSENLKLKNPKLYDLIEEALNG